MSFLVNIIIRQQILKYLTPKCGKYSNDYHSCKAELCTVSNVIKYDMQNYVNAILNK